MMIKAISKLYYFTSPRIRKLLPLTYHDVINKELGKDIKSILDVGCGEGNSIERIERAKDAYLVGIDVYPPCIKKAKKRKIYDKILCEDINKLNVADKSFDAILFISVIEHLSREDGKKILNKFDKIARKLIIILTPNGYLPQDAFDNNPYQKHKSGDWTDELVKRGYRIRGADGINFQTKKFKYNPILMIITQPFVYFLPRYAASIIAIKRLSGRN